MIIVNLKKILDENNLTMTDIHNKTGISKNTLSLMANGKSKGIQFETLDKLLEFLSVDISELLTFVSKKEIESMSVEIIPKSKITRKFDKKHEEIYAVSPPQKKDESDAEYELRLEGIEEEIIGYLDSLELCQDFNIKIHYDNFSCEFVVCVRFIISGIANKKAVKKKFEESKYYNGENFDEYQSMYQSKYIFIDDYIKNISKLTLSDYQKFVIQTRLSKLFINNIPSEFRKFSKEYDVFDTNDDLIYFNY